MIERPVLASWCKDFAGTLFRTPSLVLSQFVPAVRLREREGEQYDCLLSREIGQLWTKIGSQMWPLMLGLGMLLYWLHPTLRPKWKWINDMKIMTKFHQNLLISDQGKPSFKKYQNFMKYFHKTETPPPVLHLWNPYSDFPTNCAVITISE